MPIPTKEPTLLDRETATAIVPATNPLTVIERFASDPNIDVTKLEKLIEMQERILMQQARQEFNRALSAAQNEMQPIAADAENPQTRSRYASYAQLDRALRPIYTRYGFGLSFDTADSPKEEHVRVVCYATHNAGWGRDYHVDMPADGKGAKGGDVMTKTHAAGAAMSYGMRYLLKMIFNVAVGEEDTDGNGPRVTQQKPTAIPAGYDEWLADMASAADEGWPKLSKAFSASKPEYRKHVTGPDKAKWTALRAKAEKVQHA